MRTYMLPTIIVAVASWGCVADRMDGPEQSNASELAAGDFSAYEYAADAGTRAEDGGSTGSDGGPGSNPACGCHDVPTAPSSSRTKQYRYVVDSESCSVCDDGTCAGQCRFRLEYQALTRTGPRGSWIRVTTTTPMPLPDGGTHSFPVRETRACTRKP